MNIGIVLSATPSYSETFFMSKIKGLQKQGHHIVLFAQSKVDDFELCKVNLAYPIFKRNLLKQLWYFGRVFFKLLNARKHVQKYIQLEKENGITGMALMKSLYTNAHILTESLDWLHFGFATMALGKEQVAKSIGANMAVSFRGFDMAIYPIKFPNCYDLVWKQVDKVHTISDDLYALALGHGLSHSVPVQKITPAIDVQKFQPKAPKVFSKQPLKMLTVARLHWKKGLTDTLVALKMLKDQGVSFQYTIVGEGAEYEKLAFLRHSLHLTEEVTFAGKVSHDAIQELMAAHEIYIQYSISEGFCNAVLEAQAMGMLCVVSNAEGLSENVVDGQSGWVLPKNSPEKLAEKLGAVSNLAKDKKDAIRKFSMDRVRREFNLIKQQQEFLEFYTYEH